MEIQINGDKNIPMHAKLSSLIEADLHRILNRFKPQLTRIEVHLTDETGDKPAPARNAACSKLDPGTINPSPSPTTPRISRPPSPVPPPRCTDTSKPHSAASRVNVAESPRN